MSKNKRAPKELNGYVVVIGNNTSYGVRYFKTQKEAKAWAKTSTRAGKRRLFRVDYDFYGEL